MVTLKKIVCNVFVFVALGLFILPIDAAAGCTGGMFGLYLFDWRLEGACRDFNLNDHPKVAQRFINALPCMEIKTKVDDDDLKSLHGVTISVRSSMSLEVVLSEMECAIKHFKKDDHNLIDLFKTYLMFRYVYGKWYEDYLAARAVCT